MINKKVLDIDNEIVNEHLAALEEWYGEPVLPISKYCEAFETWAQCIIKANEKKARAQGFDYYERLHSILIDIKKSNLLARLLYDKEKFRTKECPIHKGVWNGDAMLTGNCLFACDGTGWLREE